MSARRHPPRACPLLHDMKEGPTGSAVRPRSVGISLPSPAGEGQQELCLQARAELRDGGSDFTAAVSGSGSQTVPPFEPGRGLTPVPLCVVGHVQAPPVLGSAKHRCPLF